MSRKISFRGGFDNCIGKSLKTRGASHTPSYCKVGGMWVGRKELRLSDWFNVSKDSIDFVHNTGVYFGLGIFSGRFGSDDRAISAPLIIYPAEYDSESGASGIPDVLWSSPQINIDLLAILLAAPNPDEEDLNLGILGGVMKDKIREIETLIKKIKINSASDSNGPILASKIFDLVQGCDPRINFTKSEGHSHEFFLNTLEKSVTPIFFPCALFFNANKPSDVTTFYAINEMMEQLDSDDVKNYLLNELIESTIEQRAPDLDRLDGAASEIDEEIFNFIPLGLSDSQNMHF